MTRPQTPEEQARLESIKRSWQQKRQITERLSHIKKKIGVYSGKGGVGKTTVAVNLAVTLARKGYRVGLMDTDVDCPNASNVLGAYDRPEIQDGLIVPPEKHGVRILSMAFFQENQEEAIIWRGPMIHNAINQFLETTAWGDLDCLVVDLPPGTSDAPLTVMQMLNMDGFVVVTTPQALSKLDSKRSINMIRKMNVKVLGVVENFSGEMFGTGAGEELAQEMGLPFLGRLEMRPDYRDTSKPSVLVSPAVAAEYEVIALALEPALSATEASS
ncbi:MAG: Iron-sulfur cluster carrier protein [Dehalococcoidia bacterium]|nr:Iron-sulfur cluster carrier protein [Dehalococcoidia bacterium]